MAGDNREDVILAIEVNGEAAGGIGLHGLKDVTAITGRSDTGSGFLLAFMDEHLYALLKDQWLASPSG